MIENIVTIKLNVDEELVIRKNSLCAVNPTTDKRIAVVTGIHGDELEGQYICYKLVKTITEKMQNLKGRIDIYPAINPLGMESVSRAVPTSGQAVFGGRRLRLKLREHRKKDRRGHKGRGLVR